MLNRLKELRWLSVMMVFVFVCGGLFAPMTQVFAEGDESPAGDQTGAVPGDGSELPDDGSNGTDSADEDQNPPADGTDQGNTDNGQGSGGDGKNAGDNGNSGSDTGNENGTDEQQKQAVNKKDQQEKVDNAKVPDSLSVEAQVTSDGVTVTASMDAKNAKGEWRYRLVNSKNKTIKKEVHKNREITDTFSYPLTKPGQYTINVVYVGQVNGGKKEITIRGTAPIHIEVPRTVNVSADVKQDEGVNITGSIDSKHVKAGIWEITITHLKNGKTHNIRQEAEGNTFSHQFPITKPGDYSVNVRWTGKAAGKRHQAAGSTTFSITSLYSITMENQLARGEERYAEVTLKGAVNAPTGNGKWTFTLKNKKTGYSDTMVVNDDINSEATLEVPEAGTYQASVQFVGKLDGKEEKRRLSTRAIIEVNEETLPEVPVSDQVIVNTMVEKRKVSVSGQILDDRIESGDWTFALVNEEANIRLEQKVEGVAGSSADAAFNKVKPGNYTVHVSFIGTADGKRHEAHGTSEVAVEKQVKPVVIYKPREDGKHVVIGKIRNAESAKGQWILAITNQKMTKTFAYKESDPDHEGTKFRGVFDRPNKPGTYLAHALFVGEINGEIDMIWVAVEFTVKPGEEPGDGEQPDDGKEGEDCPAGEQPEKPEEVKEVMDKVKNGGALPNTATDYPLGLLAGLGVLVLGLAGWKLNGLRKR